MFSTSVSALEFPLDRSKPRGAACSASTQIRGWPSFARRGGFEVEVAKFEAWDPAGRVFDAVIAGQTWHWVDPVAGAAKAADVLRPGGRIAVFWNVFQFPPDLSEAFAAVYHRVLPGLPFFQGMSGGLQAYSGQFTKAADGMREVGLFGPPERVAIRLGAVLHQGRVVGRGSDLRRPQPVSCRQIGRTLGGARGRDRRGGR